MVNSPCKDCPNRTKPKSCETNCPKWQEYLIKKNKEKETIKQNKHLFY